MCSIHEDFAGIDQMVFIALFEDMGEDLFEEVCIFKPTGIILAESREVRHLIRHSKTEEPPIRHVYFDLPDRLPHTPDPIQILDERDLDQHHRIDTGPAVICTVFFFDKLIDEGPVDGLINDPEQVILRDQVFHAEELVLFP